MHDAKEIDASALNSDPRVILIIAQIAALSPTLKAIDISFNDLEEFSPDVAAALARSRSIDEVYMEQTNLGSNGIYVARYFAQSSIRTIDLSSNGLKESGPDVAEALASSRSINAVYIDHNKLGNNLCKTLENLLSSDTIRAVSIQCDDDRKYSLQIANIAEEHKQNTISKSIGCFSPELIGCVTEYLGHIEGVEIVY